MAGMWIFRLWILLCSWTCLLHQGTAIDYRGAYNVKRVRISPNDAMSDPFILVNDGLSNVSTSLKQYSKIKHKYTGTVMLEYTLGFSNSFSWGERGGLLPGLIGGSSKCAKRESGSRCWRVQLKWNPDGTAGVALRLPKDKESRVQNSIKASIKWLTSRDNKVTMVLGVNSRRKRDGFLDVSINNERLLFQNGIRFDEKTTRSKFVLRQGEYIGKTPYARGGKLQYIHASDIQVYLAKQSAPPPVASPPPPSLPPPPPPSPLPKDPIDEFLNNPSDGLYMPGDQEWWNTLISPSPQLVSPPIQDPTSPLTISLKWTTGVMQANLPKRSPRRFDHVAKELHLCSGDKLRLEWSGENMGVYGFYTLDHYENCIKDDLNYIKNTRPSGYFLTKANRGGWRYYAYITGADDGACKYGCGTERDKGKEITGTCAQKVAVLWNKC